MIAQAGAETSMWFNENESLQWAPAKMWTMFCGTIPAFAFVIMYEQSQRGTESEKQEFFKSLEDALFVFYKEYSKKVAPLRECVPNAAERSKVCDMYNVDDDINMGMDTILGIIFPGRLHQYQSDLAASIASASVHAPFEYAAMRLAADLTGVPTPKSLVGQSAEELGILAYGDAIIPLIEFGNAYTQNRP